MTDRRDMTELELAEYITDIACVEHAGSVEAVRKCRVRCRPSPTADSK